MLNHNQRSAYAQDAIESQLLGRDRGNIYLFIY